MSTHAAILARHVVTLQNDDVPVSVRAQAVRLIMDAVGAGIYGTTTASGTAIFEEARSRYRTEGSLVWGRSVTLDPAGAALVNAAQTHAFEMDDYLSDGKTHPGTVIVPAAFAIAPDGTTGRELVTAVIAAYDVMCRVALAMGPNSVRGRGFHITGLSGPFGATAAAGRLLGLDENELTSAFGIAASCAAGIFAFTGEGAMTKPLHAGRAAEAGVVAVRLARWGFDGPTDAFEANDGGLLDAVSDNACAEELTKDLGVRYDLERVSIKPYPCCGSIHSSIDAILELRRVHEIGPADVGEITVHNARGVLLQCGFDYTGTGGPVEAQMSLQYCLAAALTDGSVGLRQFEEERRRDPALLEIARRVRFEIDDELDASYPSSFAARVGVRLADGSTLESRVSAPLGSPQNPLSSEGVRAKFVELTEALVSSGARDELLSELGQLDSDVTMATVRATLGRASANPVALRS